MNVNEKSASQAQDSDNDEVKDVVGETRFMKRIKSVRSSSLLHSVEDLSTDSTCVYKARSGFDSNRSSRRSRNKNTLSTDEILTKIPLTDKIEISNEISGGGGGRNRQSAIQIAANRGLSKSMIIPTPISDISEMEDEDAEKGHRTCCDKIKRYNVDLKRFFFFKFMFVKGIWTLRCCKTRNSLQCVCP